MPARTVEKLSRFSPRYIYTGPVRVFITGQGKNSLSVTGKAGCKRKDKLFWKACLNSGGGKKGKSGIRCQSSTEKEKKNNRWSFPMPAVYLKGLRALLPAG